MCEAHHYGQRSKSRPFRLPLGRVLATKGALEALVRAGDDPNQFLDRHASGDWGNIGPLDRMTNNSAAASGGPVLSAYSTAAGDRLWVATQADRSGTVLMLPEEY